VKFGAHYCFFINVGKKAKSISLAPVEVKTLLCRGSAQKVVAENGTMLAKMPNLSASN